MALLALIKQKREKSKIVFVFLLVFVQSSACEYLCNVIYSEYNIEKGKKIKYTNRVNTKNIFEIKIVEEKRTKNLTTARISLHLWIFLT